MLFYLLISHANFAIFKIAMKSFWGDVDALSTSSRLSVQEVQEFLQQYPLSSIYRYQVVGYTLKYIDLDKPVRLKHV